MSLSCVCSLDCGCLLFVSLCGSMCELLLLCLLRELFLLFGFLHVRFLIVGLLYCANCCSWIVCLLYCVNRCLLVVNCFACLLVYCANCCLLMEHTEADECLFVCVLGCQSLVLVLRGYVDYLLFICCVFKYVCCLLMRSLVVG